MNKLWMSAAAAVVVLATTGCMSHNVSQPNAPIAGTVTADLKANIDVGGEITGQSTSNILFGVLKISGDSQFADGVSYGGPAPAFSLPDPISATKAAAAYKAVKSSGSDLIVAPRYAVSVQDYFIFKKVNVTVTGNKGSIKSIR
ncbi:hypothetical protein ACIGCH_01300 [Pseudomonas helleri]|uniref:Lipoprotein n=1 Tax=Pseudomonas helleri TaxID=1608996 RepID=A0A6A7YVT1_9PSED|nr:hypothetical protein [Pseudomonas helleri]MQT25778.1 hypothetical protein [Pseudomonas helleri]MQT81141.1 hypothetical protein [Pseudomonas helleri]MQU17029.1 hypothetical protein [Pseudomonas helleri]MQU28059.1 hypothetical protein [Pseudomonas helleri]